MGEENKIKIVSEYTDLSSAKIKSSFKKNEKSAVEFSQAVEKMRKSMQRSMNKSRKEMKASLDQMSKSMKNTGKHTKRAGKEVDRMRILTQGFRREVGKARNIMLLWFFVFRPLQKAFNSLTIAMVRQEDAIHRLNVAVQSQGVFTEHTSKKLQEMAASFQKVTRFGDEAILEVMQKLVSLGRVLPSQLEKVTRATLDLAASQKIELRTATDLVAKAATGYTGTLSRYGIMIDRSIPASKKFSEVIRLINKQWGGAAQADIKTYSGQVEQMGNNFGDAKEKLGKFLVEHLRLQNIVFPFWDELLDKTNAWLKALNNPTQRQFMLNQTKALDKQISMQERLVDAATRGAKLILFGDRSELDSRLKKLEELRASRVRIVATLEQEKTKQFELEKIEVNKSKLLEEKAELERRQFEKEQQFGKMRISMQKTFAMQAMQSWEDLFFNAMTGKFREMEDVVIQFGNTVLKMMIRLGIQKAFIGAGFGELIGAGVGTGAHSGGYMTSGRSASYGAPPKRKSYHRGGEVDATLLDGEFVVNRQGTKNAGIDNLNKLNRGNGMGGTTINNFYDVQTIDERSFRDRLEQNGDIYSGAISSDLPANREVRRSIQRFGR